MATATVHYKRGEWVDVTVDGEVFRGEIIKRSWYKNKLRVTIPFYYSESEKHGRPGRRPSKTVWVDADSLTV